MFLYSRRRNKEEEKEKEEQKVCSDMQLNISIIHTEKDVKINQTSTVFPQVQEVQEEEGEEEP